VGAPAAWSFGPVMRFVAGGWYGAAAVTRRIAELDHRPVAAVDVGADTAQAA
jgi:hypothetical protein